MAEDVHPTTSATRFSVPSAPSDALHDEGSIPTGVLLPPAVDALPDMEDQVRVRITDRLRDAPTSYLPTTDDESDAYEHKNRGVSGKLRTSDTTVVRQVTWHHEVVYYPSAQPVVYEQIFSMAFVNGYIIIISKDLPHTKAFMLTYLQELKEDGDHYRWPAVRAYHAAWLQHIEQGRTAWGDDERKIKLHHALV